MYVIYVFIYTYERWYLLILWLRKREYITETSRIKCCHSLYYNFTLLSLTLLSLTSYYFHSIVTHFIVTHFIIISLYCHSLYCHSIYYIFTLLSLTILYFHFIVTHFTLYSRLLTLTLYTKYSRFILQCLDGPLTAILYFN